MHACRSTLEDPTAFGALVGTPAYMAPEQATFNQLDVDTRADVYALGVLLYELLAGSPPFEPARLRRVALDEVLRLVREEDPQRPSARLSTSEARASIAAVRQTEPAKLSKLMRGELDWIVMKALEKDRTRRYETATGFAADVQRYLAGDPVQAVPPSAGYRLRKFARRNRGPVAVAGLVACALLAGIAGTTLGLVRADRARAAAEAAREAEAGQRREAEQANRQAVRALGSFTDEFVEKQFAARTELGENEKAILRNALAQWEVFARSKGEGADARALRAEGAFRVATVQQRLGLNPEAEANFRTAVALRERLAADDPAAPEHRAELARGRHRLGLLLDRLGRRAEAEEQYLAAVAGQERLAAEFPAVPDFRSAAAESQNDLGVMRCLAGRHAEAAGPLDAALALRERLAADFPDVPAFRFDVARSLHNRALLWQNVGRLADAEGGYRRALAVAGDLVSGPAALPEYRLKMAQFHSSLGTVLLHLDRPAAAAEQVQKALADWEALADDFPGVPENRINLGGGCCNFGNMLRASDRAADSLPYFDKAVRVLTAVSDRDPHLARARLYLANSHASRAQAYDALGKFPEAVRDWDRAVDLCPKERQPLERTCRAVARLNAGQVAEAVAEAADLLSPTATPYPWTGAVLYDFVRIYAVASATDPARREEYAARSVELLRRTVDLGYADPDEFAREASLDPLRGRPDYQKLLAEVRAKAGPAKDPSPPPKDRK